MKTIYLSWFKLPFGKSNFGDELSPYIIKKLTGARVVYMPYNETKIKKKILLFFKLLLFRKSSFRGIIEIILYHIKGKSFVIYGIGSIIRMNNYRKSIIWGSGIISKGEYIKDSTFLAVRGRHTQNRIIELGYNPPKVLGDPALLLPLVHEVKFQNKKYPLGIIPHISHLHEIASNKLDNDIKIINLNDSIEKVIDDINFCEKTICSSLHGIIVSHAYGIPSLWVNLSNLNLAGDDIKFADYFSSVKIEEYSPLKSDKKYSNVWAERLFENYSQYCLPGVDVIDKLQKGLLKCAPFEILEPFKMETS